MIFYASKSKSTAVESLFDAYYVRLCEFSVRILKDEELAEDIVQEVFVGLCENPELIPKDLSKTKSFLYSCVKNACFNSLRHQFVVEKHQSSINLDEEESVVEHIIHAEILGEIHHAISSLPPGCAAIFRKGYLEGLSNTKIAEQLNISINTVKSQKQRGLILLRKVISPEILTLLISPFATIFFN